MYGHRARIGYTSPPRMTEVFPYEFYKIVPEGVTLVLTTLAIVELTSDEVNKSYEISLQAAREMARAGVDLVVLGGVPINLSRGYDNVEALIRDTQKEIGIPVTTSITAQINSLQTLGARKIAVAQPFEEESQHRQDGAMYAGYLRRYGFEMVAARGAGRRAIDLGRISSEVPHRIGRELKRDHSEVDTLYFPCPHWAVAEQIDPLEQEFGVNVVTALQAIVWESLRRCGIKDRVDGYGRLLREF